jgi:serine/threonine protein kinase
MASFFKSIFEISNRIKIESDLDTYSLDLRKGFLDEGNYAKIYKAKNKKKQNVILKILYSESDFRQEVECNLALLRNLPNTCNKQFICMIDYFVSNQHEDFYFVIVFPFLKNYYSFDKIQNKMSDNQKIKMVGELTDLVALLNKTGIVHNDIHFGNIMVRLSPFDVKLIDIGNCIVSDEQKLLEKDMSMIRFFFK